MKTAVVESSTASKTLDFESWNIIPHFKNELKQMSKQSEPVTTSTGVFQVGDWVIAQRNLANPNCSPYQIVAFTNSGKIAHVSIFNTQNCLDKIPTDELYPAETPTKEKNYFRPMPYDGPFEILATPRESQQKAETLTLETQLKNAVRSQKEAEQFLDVATKNLFEAQNALKVYENEIPKTEGFTRVELAEFYENDQKRSSELKTDIADSQNELTQAKNNVERCTKNVSNLKAKIERKKQISVSLNEYQKHYEGLTAELKKLGNLKAFSTISFSTNGTSIPYFDKNGGLKLRSVSDLLRGV